MADGRALLVSAPGKVIIHGEHAVVYGKPALAASVDLRCYMLLTSSAVQSNNDPTINLDLPDLCLTKSWLISHLCTSLTQPLDNDECAQTLRQLAGISEGDNTPSTDAVACLAFLYLLVNIYGDKLKDLTGLQVTVVATLPAGAGLGSSAAFSVCLAAGMLSHSGTITSLNHSTSCDQGEKSTKEQSSQCTDTCMGPTGSTNSCLIPDIICKKMKDCGYTESLSQLAQCDGEYRTWSKAELDIINKWGFEAEKLIHGTPSGIDNSISTFGGAICFQTGKITLLDRMPQLRILLVNTKVPRSTKKMVSGVRERYNKFTDVIQPILDSIEAVVNSAMQIFAAIHRGSGDHHVAKQADLYSLLQELFAVNHHLLNALGVGHSSLDGVCQVVDQFGLTGKLTGGGGGGCAIALIPPGFSEDKLSELTKALEDSGCECWTTVVGTRGVSQH